MELFILSLFLFATLYYLSWALISMNPKPNYSITNGKLIPLPPGSKGWPVIGETFDYLSRSKNGVPEKFIAERRDKYSTTIFQSPLLKENMVFFCTAEGNKFLFSNENKLVKTWWPKTFEKIFGGPVDLSLGDEAKGFRKILSPFLKPDSLHKYVEIMDDETRKHLNTYWNGIDEEEVLTVYPLARKYTFKLGCRIFMSMEDPETTDKLQDHFKHVTRGLVSKFPVNIPGTKYNRAIRATEYIKRYIEKIIVQRRKDVLEDKAAANNIKHDLLNHLLMVMSVNLNDEFKSDYDISSKLCGLLNGAHENSSAVLTSIMAYLADLPHVYNEVYREQMEIANSKATEELLNWTDIQKMKYSWNVACEVMRLAPPTQGTFREVLKDFEYDGFQVPKGFKIHWNAFATHKNPKYFPNPEKLEPSRFEGEGPIPFSYIPFGGGPRMCPGQEYARLNILIFMHNIVKNFRWEKVFPDEKITVDPVSKPSKGLPIRLYPHKP